MAASVNFADWDEIDPLSLAQAANLWAELEPEPGHVVTTEGRAYQVFTKLKQWCNKHQKYPQKAKGHNGISCKTLKEIAETWGERPAFLFPKERAPEKRKIGEPKPETSQKRQRHHDDVEALVKQGMTIEDAAENVAKRSGEKASSIVRNRNRWKNHIGKKAKM